jgi:hypothetical protein
MSGYIVMKRLIDIGLPDKWVLPVMEAFDVEDKPVKKRRKRRTAAQMAAAKKVAKKTTKKK